VGGDVRSWVLTITRYQVMGECTRMKRLADSRRPFVPQALVKELEHRLVEETEEPNQRLEALRQCSETLPPAWRELLSARYDDDLTLELIAERTNRSLGAIKKQFFTIRHKLHECINQRLAQEMGQ
jgi:RNA polymerase sigma-70 factor (ECF subfamily)